MDILSFARDKQTRAPLATRTVDPITVLSADALAEVGGGEPIVIPL